MNNKSKELDQFYTNPKVSDFLVSDVMPRYYDLSKFTFLEPSAGTGNFISSLLKSGVSKKNIMAFDIDPKSNGFFKIKKSDFLKTDISFSKKRIIIGNPPFGKRARLAIEFINKSFEIANHVAMILPKQFERFLTQKQVDIGARLVLSMELEGDAFIHSDSPYDVKSVFQIWTKNPDMPDIRLKSQKQLRHHDFTTYIHNNTINTLKYFDKSKYKWDFAVHRQGYYDYKNIITNSKDLIKNRQYFFIKANNAKARKVIKSIDFEALSRSNTQTPGFSTTDFVEEYKRKIGE